MKKNLLTLIYLIIIVINAESQCIERQYIPNWDWRTPTYDIVTYGSNYQPVNLTIESPWFAQYSNNPNINSFRLQNPKDFEPTDGWVLVQREFGTAMVPVNHPYFILYNRQTGFLRVFVAVTQLFEGYSSALITLAIPGGSKKTAILGYHSPSDFRSSLQEFENDPLVVSFPNTFSNDLPYWLHADFVMNYDPCTCNDNSQLVFDAKLIDEATLEFEMNGTLQTHIDNTGQAGDGRQSFIKLGKDAVDAGNSFYKSSQTGLQNLQNIFPNLLSKESPLNNVLPGLGAAAGVVDFLIGAVGGSSPKPTVYDISLNASGHVIEAESYRREIFETPGSDNLTMEPPTLLQYNNTLGVYTMLSTPEVIVAYDPGGPQPNGSFRASQSKYRMNTPVSYAVNPFAGFSRYNMIGALVFTFQTSSQDTQYNNWLNWVLEDLGANLVYEGVVDGKHLYRTEYVPIGCLTDLTVHFRQVPGGRRPVDIGVKTILKCEMNDARTTAFVTNYKVNRYLGDLSNSPYNQYFDNYNYFPISLTSIPQELNVYNKTWIVQDQKAWDIVRWRNSTIFPSSNVNVLAGKEITVEPGSEIKAGVTIRAGIPSVCTENTQPASESQISSICNSSKYISRTPATRIATKSGNEAGVGEELREEEISAFPNPATAAVNFTYYLNADTKLSLEVLDLTGRIIMTLVDWEGQEKGVHELSYNSSSLKPGIYMYRFRTGDFQKIRRLVIE